MKSATQVLIGILIFLCTVFAANAQLLELQVENVKRDSFPKYTGELVVRNPAGIDLDKISFFEGDSVIDINFEAGSQSESKYSGKEVLFLVLNHQSFDNRTKWYQDVILDAVDKGLINDGDSYAIQSFDCMRPEYNDPNKQLLFPAKPEFTSSKSDLQAQVNAIDLNKRKFSSANCQVDSDIYGAIYQALQEFNNLANPDGKCRSIVIFADDRSLVRAVKEQGIIERSRDFDIPVNGITYFQNIQGKFGVKSICEDTYGEYFIDKSNKKKLATTELLNICSKISTRSSGFTYPFSFNSPFGKDGKEHAVQVKYNKEVTVFKYESPSMSITEWAKENPIMAAGIVGGVLLLIMLIIVFVRKRRKRNAAKEQEVQEEMRKMEEQQTSADLKSAQQEEMIRRLKEDQKAKEESEYQKNLAEQKEKENQEKLEQMLIKGTLPWFSYSYQGQSGSFEMNHPEFTVGREENNNYRINLPIVSRNHFSVKFNQGQYTIEDLGSSNGTVVNGQRISSTVLKHGDVISIGDIDLTFHI